MDNALDTASAAHAQAMDDFGSATGFGEGFPRDLLVGGGGAADRLRDGLRALAAKSVAKARQRLDATINLLRTQAGLRTTIRLEPPRPTHEQGPNPGSGTVQVGTVPLTIDILIGLSDAAGLQGGAVFAGGQSHDSFGTVELTLDGSDFQSGQAIPDPARLRWGHTFGALDLVDGGGEVLEARQGTGAPVNAAVGVP